MRCACRPGPGPIDVHTHFVPSHMPAAAGRVRPDEWPVMTPPDCGHALLTFGKAASRKVASVSWDAAGRLEDMAAERVGVQVLSPMPDLFAYHLAAQDGADLCRHVNDELSALVSSHAGRFMGLGMVPMQHGDSAVREVERIAATLPLQGVEIGTNVCGVAIGDARFHPVFEACERLDLAVFVHPAAPIGAGMVVGPRELLALIPFPTDSAFALASLVTGGVLERFPRLRLGASHGGGGFGAVLPRLQHAWERVPAVRDSMATSPAEAARRLYFDTLVLSQPGLRYALDAWGADRLMLGSDYPFALGDRQALASLEAVVADAAVREALTRTNALDFLCGRGPG